ncbi:hypothetical protein [Nocardioides mangrovi]|uniref:DUF1906 domain-containing protein n=1 Tax=Nocardioides mangrovi TaxID=2874580 RepID=A0ABS7UJF5_9ACTN|nr:hypothetical protein [Nocardioides mangrovi]MBZ5741159.1 hypothetical protein [Nocardioides mangrovi]
MIRRAAALVAAVALLAGCSTSDPGDAGPTPTTSPPSPRPTAVVTAEVDRETSRLRALAQLAEAAAATIPTASPPRIRAQGDETVLGADISWPQCPKGMGIPERRTLGLPMPTDEAQYVVLGLTNGPGFTANPCLADQVAWVQERHLLAAAYAVVSQPDASAIAEHGTDGPFDGTTELGSLANTGYQQALANVATMRRAGLASPVVWLDVEHVPDFEWSSDVTANAAVVQGAARGYQDAGYHAGVYSTPSLWSDVVGDLALGLPEWRAAGQTSREEALDRCGDDWRIQDGDAVLAQWVEDRRDLDVTCPGAAARLGRWFTQY